jgi:hypothetical protein
MTRPSNWLIRVSVIFKSVSFGLTAPKSAIDQCGHEIPVVLMRLSCTNLDAQIGGMAVFVRPSKVQYFG